MIGVKNEVITEDLCNQITIIVYCPHCGIQNCYPLNKYERYYNYDYDGNGIIFCIGCGEQI